MGLFIDLANEQWEPRVDAGGGVVSVVYDLTHFLHRLEQEEHRDRYEVLQELGDELAKGTVGVSWRDGFGNEFADGDANLHLSEDQVTIAASQGSDFPQRSPMFATIVVMTDGPPGVALVVNVKTGDGGHVEDLVNVTRSW